LVNEVNNFAADCEGQPVCIQHCGL
jgi:hypothetical protein